MSNITENNCQNFGMYLDFTYDSKKLLAAFSSVVQFKEPFLNRGYDIIRYPAIAKTPGAYYCSELSDTFKKRFLIDMKVEYQFIDIPANHTIPIHRDRFRNFVVIFPLTGNQPTVYYDYNQNIIGEMYHYENRPMLLDARQLHNTTAAAVNKVNFQLTLPATFGLNFKKIKKYFVDQSCD